MLTIVLIILLVLAPTATFVLGAMFARGAGEDELKDTYYAGYGQALEDEGPSATTLLQVGLAMDPETANDISAAFSAALAERVEHLS